MNEEEMQSRFYEMIFRAAQLADIWEFYKITEDKDPKVVEELVEDFTKAFIRFSDPLFDHNFQTFFLKGKGDL